MKRSWNGFSRADVIAMLLVIGVLTCLVSTIGAAPRETAKNMKCMSNVRSIAGGMNNYLSAYGVFPAPTEQFRGDCWLASLYWQGFLSDKRIYICPETMDNADLLQEPRPGKTGFAAYPIPPKMFAQTDGVLSEAISYCGPTPMEGLAAKPTQLTMFTERHFTGLPICCDDPKNHLDGTVNVAYIDQHVVTMDDAGDYVGIRWMEDLKPGSDRATLVTLDSGDSDPLAKKTARTETLSSEPTKSKADTALAMEKSEEGGKGGGGSWAIWVIGIAVAAVAIAAAVVLAKKRSRAGA